MIGAMFNKEWFLETENHCVMQLLVERGEGGNVYRFLWFRLTVS
jgi:hypothetical protein